MSSEPNNFTWIDKALHRLAFAKPVRHVLNDLENSIYRKCFESEAIASTIYVCGLPRAGTTTLLNVLAASPDTTSQSYRDMPFIQSPLLWRKISARFRKTARKRLRAHRDGVSFDEDSPEAFEEVLWLEHFPEKYHSHHIELWSEADWSDDYVVDLQNHCKKLLLINKLDGGNANKVLIKNNANVSRLQFLSEIQPKSLIIVPFRDPSTHANSLWQQHKHFLKFHAEDKFSLRYMSDLGHFDFGAGFKPIDFPGLRNSGYDDPTNIEYWMLLWTSAYTHILETLPKNAVLFDYDLACADSTVAVDALRQKTEISIPVGMNTVFRTQERNAPKAPNLALDLWSELKRSDRNLIKVI
ncbi:MAG: sulfotransferase [Rhizobiaceae bacterium]